jgi:hypothetical protein
MNKYTHTKTGNALKEKTRRDGSSNIPRGLKEKTARAAANHETVEQVFGSGHPNFGGSLGTDYNIDGTISKVNRAKSVE